MAVRPCTKQVAENPAVRWPVRYSHAITVINSFGCMHRPHLMPKCGRSGRISHGIQMSQHVTLVTNAGEEVRR